jgi:CarD family transcriptional regulator
MRFTVGDQVVHPQHGPGTIVQVQHRELVEGFEHYYVIESLANGAVWYVPVRKVEEIGVRPVMSEDKLARVLSTLRGAPTRLAKDFKTRQQRIREKLSTARPITIAEAVRDLTYRRRQKYLTKVDQRLLDRGRNLLASEMAAVSGTEILDAEAAMDAALKSGITSQETMLEEAA